jgi:hypothetical protein
LEARLLNGGAEIRSQFSRESGKVGRRVVRVNTPGFDAREVKQRINKLQQPHRVAMGNRNAGTVVGTNLPFRFGEDLFKRPQHQGKRGPKFMADVRKERGFGTVDFGQNFGPPPLLLIGLCIRDRGSNLSSDEGQKSPIIVVKQAKRI